MADPPEQPQDPISEPEMTGGVVHADNAPADDEAERPRNAFTELMSRKRPRLSPVSAGSPKRYLQDNPLRPKGTTLPHGIGAAKSSAHFPGRSGLEAYITSPQSFPAFRVVSYDDTWVLIRDLYPKASVHLLLLPRDLSVSHKHPFEALSDPGFLASARVEAEKAASVAAAELRHLYGAESAGDAARFAAMEADPPPSELPPGRDWRASIKAGVHTHPSMTNLHIHILSVDMHSPALKHRKHYNSFNTDFFVPLDAWPLDGAEMQRRYNLPWPDEDLRCWRCGRVFGREFKKLKEHLEGEWRLWKRE